VVGTAAQSRLRRWIAVSLTTVVATGCGDDGSSAKDAPTPTRSSPSVSRSTAPPADPVAEGTRAALAAYRGMWAAFVAASNSGATNPPALVEYTGGSALPVLNRGLTANKAKALVSKGNPTISPKLTSIGPLKAPTSATILDCVDDTRWLLYRSDGRLADDVPGGRSRANATVERVGERWKVTSFALQGPGTC